MKRADFRYLDRQRVRWVDVDMQKIVFNGHYLTYVDTAHGGLLARAGLALSDHDDAPGRRPVRAQGHAGIPRVGPSTTTRWTWGCAASTSATRRCVTSPACSVARSFWSAVSWFYVYADPVAKRGQPVPAELRELLMGFEAGQPMLDLRVGTWERPGPGGQRHPPTGVCARATRAGGDGGPTRPMPNACTPWPTTAWGLALATGRLLDHAPGGGQDRPHGGAAVHARQSQSAGRCWTHWWPRPGSAATRR